MPHLTVLSIDLGCRPTPYPSVFAVCEAQGKRGGLNGDAPLALEKKPSAVEASFRNAAGLRYPKNKNRRLEAGGTK